ncbi:MAG: sigma 54-interacting transcriptional regulator [Myxococcota bacterium]
MSLSAEIDVSREVGADFEAQNLDCELVYTSAAEGGVKLSGVRVTEMVDSQRVVRERDLYRRLLELGDTTEVEPFLSGALELVVEVTGSSQGLIEIRDLEGNGEDTWSMAHSLSDGEAESIRDRISKGIIAEALATGKTVETTSAVFDDRFSSRESVQVKRIGAVLCAPLGKHSGVGNIYLEKSNSDGAYSIEDKECLEVFARHLATLADRVIVKMRSPANDDHMAPLRQKYALDEIIGRSQSLARAVEQAMLAAPLDVNVLITGDSGTGKTQLARAIHRNSGRAEHPFIEVNCAALPDSLIESELFGAKAGAHSTATTDLPGKVAAAESGTLFLDEIGELPIASQAKILQLLQSRSYFPLGSADPMQADIRIIAATNANLEGLVKEKLFREDLYFRLKVLAVEIPPISERTADLRDLAHTITIRSCEQNRLPKLELTEEATTAISLASWPGNVRELESAIAAAAIRAASEGLSHISTHHLFPERSAQQGMSVSPVQESFQESTRAFQSELLKRTLEETDWNISEASRRLDLARSHVYKLIDAFGFKRS